MDPVDFGVIQDPLETRVRLDLADVVVYFDPKNLLRILLIKFIYQFCINLSEMVKTKNRFMVNDLVSFLLP